jgi:hypothetical protein
MFASNIAKLPELFAEAVIRSVELIVQPDAHESCRTLMSAFGTKQTSNRHPAMSAFGGKADTAFDP